MLAYKPKLKKLISMKNDIESRILDADYKKKPPNPLIQTKLNKLFIEIDYVEQKFMNNKNTDYEVGKFNSDIQKIKQDAENLQAKIYLQNKHTESNEDLTLKSVMFIKDIAVQIQKELEQQNQILEKTLKGVEKNKISLEKSEKKFSKLENCVEYFSNTCLITTMIVLALLIIIISSFL